MENSMPRDDGGKKPNRRQLVKNLAAVATGKFASKKDAAMAAGYSEKTASNGLSTVLSRPLVRSELTRAMEAAGITFLDIVRPIADGLKANRAYVHPKFGMVESAVPDHHERRESAKLAIDLLGGVPKVGETIPAAQGLNLFISVDNRQAVRVEDGASEVVPVPTPHRKPNGHEGTAQGQHADASPAVVPPASGKPSPRPPQPTISIGIQVTNGSATRNVQGRTNGHANGNGHKA